MNKVKKILALVCCAVLLVCISVGATLAFLIDKTKVVENTFTVGMVSIALDEARVNEEGEPLDKNGEKVEKVEDAERVIANKYKLMPGHTYVKDPTVTVAADCEESYIRMMVTINKISELKAIFGFAADEDFLPEQFVNETWDSSIWPCVAITDNGDNTATYEFRYNKTVITEDKQHEVLPALFTEIKVPDDVENTELAKLLGLNIDVEAHAIQADGFGGDAEKAWTAFDAQVAGN